MTARVRPYVAGAALLAVAMGVGRFAYTPLLVVMRADAGLSVAFAGVLASANLAGYLAGGLISMTPALRAHRTRVMWSSAFGVGLLTAAMAGPAWFWLPARFLTGVLSGFVFVLSVSIMLETAARTRSRWGLATFFSGVGFGIAVVGCVVPPMTRVAGSAGAWVMLGLASALVVVAVVPWLPRDDAVTAPASATAVSSAKAPAGFWVLAALYGVEGLAYIIPATFLVAMAGEVVQIAALAPYTWVVVGVFAAPSVVVWSAIGRRVGDERALVLAAIVQCAALVMPLVFPGAIGVLALAFGVGATFMGMTALGTSLGRAYWPARASVAIGVLTVLYGIGQIAGPLIATHIALVTGSYRLALPTAAIALLLPTLAFAGRRACVARR